jgi:glycosyltransferase involved in cell wall biosynthesis
MRIALVTWSLTKAGGAESYLETIAQPLAKLCDLAVLVESGSSSDSGTMSLPEAVPVWSVSQIGDKCALESLSAWRPEVIYCHGLQKPEFESRMLNIAPAAFFAHGYYGSCISGTKMVRFPRTQACTRRFGWQCLVQYYPRRCGGLDPREMLHLYRQQADRLTLLRRYKMILTASEFMRQEYLELGFARNTVVKLPYTLRSPSLSATETECLPPYHHEATPTDSKPWRLLFAGRMTRTKGGRELLKALPLVIGAVRRPVQLTMVGDGPERSKWQELARTLGVANPELRINFPGWLPSEKLDLLFDETDLLVVPSIWPEPFGLVGLEAARRGVPQIGFPTGGIPEWLQYGKSGYLASTPASSQALADAITKCLSNPQVHLRLRQGSLEAARGFDTPQHLRKLLDLLSTVAGS